MSVDEVIARYSGDLSKKDIERCDESARNISVEDEARRRSVSQEELFEQNLIQFLHEAYVEVIIAKYSKSLSSEVINMAKSRAEKFSSEYEASYFGLSPERYIELRLSRILFEEFELAKS